MLEKHCFTLAAGAAVLALGGCATTGLPEGRVMRQSSSDLCVTVAGDAEVALDALDVAHWMLDESDMLTEQFNRDAERIMTATVGDHLTPEDVRVLSSELAYGGYADESLFVDSALIATCEEAQNPDAAGLREINTPHYETSTDTGQ